MKHLILSREYPPAPYAPGGIGTYVVNIARLLAERGETVHIIAQRWSGAPEARTEFHNGKLIVHRIGNEDVPDDSDASERARLRRELEGLKKTSFPNQWFGWRAAFLVERLVEQEGIDVIEAQEWEAPLYYFLLRRALGMGPQRRPPCIVHLHSSAEFIRHFNGLLTTPAAYPTMKRMEDYCIRSADALLCPSRYYAAQCREHYGLPQDAIKVIPLPVGFAPAQDRSPQTWADGSICFVGRLEPRKGFIEWMEAAGRVAREDPTVHFDFVGDDGFRMQRKLLAEIPRPLRRRFRFHGSRTKAELPAYLACAKAAVVPSRWENFPNVCIEAMSSGLPVIATRLGGMVEMVEDGRTGWLAPDTGVSGMVDGLAEALRRCLAATADERASMGRAAELAVRELCDNEATVNAHVAFRAEVAKQGPLRSGSLTPPTWGLNRAMAARSPIGKASIVIGASSLAAAEPVLRSIHAQTVRPRAVAVIYREGPAQAAEAAAETPAGPTTLFRHMPHAEGAEVWNTAFQDLRTGGEDGFWLFLDEFDALEPPCLERMARAFDSARDVGVVAPWTERTAPPKGLDAPPSPEPYYQMTGNDIAPASAFRAEALGPESPFRPGMAREYDVWRLANAVMAKGWTAATLPQALTARYYRKPTIAWPQATALRAIRAELLDPFATPANRTVLDLVDSFAPLPDAGPAPRDPVFPQLRRLGVHYLRTVLLRPHRVFLAVLRRLARLSEAITYRAVTRRRGVA